MARVSDISHSYVRGSPQFWDASEDPLSSGMPPLERFIRGIRQRLVTAAWDINGSPHQNLALIAVVRLGV